MKREEQMTRRELEYLSTIFYPEIKELGNLINMELTHWLNKYEEYL